MSHSGKNVHSVAEGHVHAEWSRAIRGAGGNKLRTYAKMVESRETKFYVNCIMSKSHRSALAKFRCGVAPIRLETGRYEGLPVNERICPICMLEVEDEEHVLMRCNFSPDQRRLMLDSVQNICQNVNDMSQSDLFIFLLTNQKICKIVAKTCHLILTSRRHHLYSE